jgi:MFS family permease
MSNDPSQLPKEVRDILARLPELQKGNAASLDVKTGEGYSEKLVDAIEMIGEEKAAGFEASQPSEVTPGMRYLHSSRTIHQLVTDRNRAVGIYLAVASLLLTASGAIFNANPRGGLIITIEEIQRWCLPVAFGALAILALFIAFLLIRTRVGLIYEVAKMNALLGLPIGRVQRINPLSIHFILQALISCAGGASAALFSIFLIRLQDPDAAHQAVWIGILIGTAVTVLLMALDMVTVMYTTADHRLQRKTAQK